MINLRRVFAVARKEFIHILRDPVSLGLALGIPVTLVLLLGYALNLDLKDIPLKVLDRSQTAESRLLTDSFRGSPYFDLRGGARSYEDLEKSLLKGDILAAVVIPADFAPKVRSGAGASIQLFIDGCEATVALSTRAYMEALLLKRGVSLVPARLRGSMTQLESRIWYNPANESTWTLVPGVLTVVILVVTSILASTTVAKEWENGTMEQLLSTPVRRSELLLGKGLPYMAIGFVDVIFSVLAGGLLFHVPLRGSVVLLMFCSMIFLTGSLGFGLLASVKTRTQIIASQAALVGGFIPTLLLSGMVFSIENLPRPLQLFSYVVPGRYYITILRDIYLKGVGFSMIAEEVFFLILYAVVMALLALRALSMKLEG